MFGGIGLFIYLWCALGIIRWENRWGMLYSVFSN